LANWVEVGAYLSAVATQIVVWWLLGFALAVDDAALEFWCFARGEFSSASIHF
jgi:hypothetical protein